MPIFEVNYSMNSLYVRQILEYKPKIHLYVSFSFSNINMSIGKLYKGNDGK